MILFALFAAVVVTAWLIFAILNEDNERGYEEDEAQKDNEN